MAYLWTHIATSDYLLHLDFVVIVVTVVFVSHFFVLCVFARLTAVTVVGDGSMCQPVGQSYGWWSPALSPTHTSHNERKIYQECTLIYVDCVPRVN